MQTLLAILRRGAKRSHLLDEIRPASEALAPRWPGRVEVHAEDRAGLAARVGGRSGEAPALLRDRERCVVWDGRLDARDELGDALGISPRVAAESPVGSILLWAYDAWGLGLAPHLVGDFAFAIWDGARGRLVAARDVFGTRPLYWARLRGGVALSSEVGPLLGVDGVSRTRNESRIADSFFDELEAVDKTSTFYESIERLPPGRVLVAEEDRVRIEPYDQAVFDPGVELRLDDSAEYEARFRDVFRAVVRDRLEPRGGVGVMLSGGVDSGSIACVARDALRDGGGAGLPVFSGVSEDERGCAESAHIRDVIATGGMQPHVFTPHHAAMIEEDVRYVLSHTHDLFDTRLLELRGLLYRAARESGMVALLDGIDGDLAISLGADAIGYAARSGRWRSALREARQFARVWNQSSWGYFWGYAIRPRRPDAAARLWRTVRGPRRPVVPLKGSIISPDLARRVDLEARFAQRYREDAKDALRQRTDQRARHLRNLRSPLVPAALERYHRAAAWQGLEARHPFFDRRLAALALAMPLTQKIRDGWPKSILRRALADTVPAGVRWRKWGPNLSPLFWREVLQIERPMIDDLLSRHLGETTDYIDVNKVRTSRELWHRRGDPVEGFRVWQAAVLVSWLRRS